MYRKYLLIISLFLFSLSSFSKGYFVLSSTNSIIKEGVDLEDLRDIFMGYRVLWRNGDRIFTSHIKMNSIHMKRFLKDVVSLSPRQFNKYWRRRLFSGKGHPPLEFKTDKKVLDYVHKTDGAIGIVSKIPKRNIAGLLFIDSTDNGRLRIIKR